MALIDFHCHLDLYSDPHKVANEVVARGVYVLSVTTTPSSFEGTSRLAPAGSRIRTALGLHPELAVMRQCELPLFEKLLPQTAYVGEVGLDGSRDHYDTLDQQGGILTEILSLCARVGGRDISLHSRGAAKLLLDIIELEPLAGRPILHWYVGSARDVARASEMGCWFSIGPAMFASDRGRRAIAAMPHDRVLPETDGPFTNWRGRPARPWDTAVVATMLAEFWHEPVHIVDDAITRNFRCFRGQLGGQRTAPLRNQTRE